MAYIQDKFPPEVEDLLKMLYTYNRELFDTVTKNCKDIWDLISEVAAAYLFALDGYYSIEDQKALINEITREIIKRGSSIILLN